MGSVSETLTEGGVSLLNSDNLAGVSNSVEDYTSLNVAATNVSDTCLSVKGNDVADVEATSFVLTSRPPVAVDGCCSQSTAVAGLPCHSATLLTRRRLHPTTAVS